MLKWNKISWSKRRQSRTKPELFFSSDLVSNAPSLNLIFLDYILLSSFPSLCLLLVLKIAFNLTKWFIDSLGGKCVTTKTMRKKCVTERSDYMVPGTRSNYCIPICEVSATCLLYNLISAYTWTFWGHIVILWKILIVLSCTQFHNKINENESNFLRKQNDCESPNCMEEIGYSVV